MPRSSGPQHTDDGVGEPARVDAVDGGVDRVALADGEEFRAERPSVEVGAGEPARPQLLDEVNDLVEEARMEADERRLVLRAAPHPFPEVADDDEPGDTPAVGFGEASECHDGHRLERRHRRIPDDRPPLRTVLTPGPQHLDEEGLLVGEVMVEQIPRRRHRQNRALALLVGALAALGLVVIASTAASAVPVFDGTIAVGATPQGVAVSPDGATLYVVNQGPDTVSVIDTDTQSVTATISVGVNPILVAVSPDGGTVYVTNNGGSSVSVIDAGTNTVTATIPVGVSPYGVAVSPDGATVYVANYQDNTVSVIDTGTSTVTDTIPVGNHPLGVAVSPDGAMAYVANTDDGTVSVIDTTTNAVTAAILVGDLPHSVAVGPGGATAYVTNRGNGTVSVVDLGTNTATTVIGTGSQPLGLAVSPDSDYVYVANVGSSRLSAIDTGTSTATPINGVPQPFGVAVAPDGSTVYVTNTSTSTVSVFTEPATVPDAPTGLTATGQDRQVELTWTAPADTGGDALIDYLIEYSGDGGITWAEYAHTPSTATTAIVTGLVNGTVYRFHVSAINGVGTGAPSDDASATPAAPLPATGIDLTTVLLAVLLLLATGTAFRLTARHRG